MSWRQGSGEGQGPRLAATALHVRDAEAADADAIAAVHVAAWKAAYRGLMPDGFLDGISLESWSTQWNRRLRSAEPPRVLVALRDESVVGFAIVATPSRDEDTGGVVAEIVALNVRPDAWRSGVGRALMDAALEMFRRDGWQMASLWVLEGNHRAFEFYGRLGFALDGSSKVHAPSGTRELRMRLSLAKPA